jgi:glucokinase
VSERRWAEAEALYLEASTVENFVSHHGLALVYSAIERDADAQREIEQAIEIAAREGADPEYVATLESTRAEIERLAATRAQAPPAQPR